MFKPPTSLQPSSFARARHHPAVAGRTNHNGDTMSTIIETKPASVCDRLSGRNVTAFITRLITIIVSFVSLVGFTTTAARACACGCSVFDVGGQ